MLRAAYFLFLAALLSLPVASRAPASGAQILLERLPQAAARPEPDPLEPARCHRNRVVWSGGVARRGPDRIRPLPVRSQWDDPKQSRLLCGARSHPGFRSRPVSESPRIR